MANKTSSEMSFPDGEIDAEIQRLYDEAIMRVDQSLKSINIALNLNTAKLKVKRPPARLIRLQKWKDALEYWKEQHSVETQNYEGMAESLGVFCEICREME